MKNELLPDVLLQAIEQSFNSIVVTDASGPDCSHQIVYANPAFCRLTGYSRDELLGQSPRILQGPKTNKDVIARLRQSLQDHTFFEGSTVNYRKDGTPYDVKWNISPIRNTEGVVTHYISVQQDISSLMAAQKQAMLLAQAFNATADAVVITDAKGYVEFCNQGFEKVTGYSITEALGREPKFLKSGQHDAKFYRKLWSTILAGETFKATFVNRRKDGQLIHCDETITPIVDDTGEIQHFVCIFRDTSAREEETQRYKDMVRLDILTNTLRRGAGELVLENAYMEARSYSNIAMSLAMVDIDWFKRVNDNFGHTAGDTVLQTVARTLTAILRGSDSVIRWGGEEFLLAFHDCPLDDAIDLAEKCRIAVAALEFDKVGKVTISAGVAQLQTDEPLGDLIDRADKALYRAKHAGRDQVAAG